MVLENVLFLLHAAVQFSQHHLLKDCSLLDILASFVIVWSTVDLWVYNWAFYSVLFNYISVFVPVPYCFDCKILTICPVLYSESEKVWVAQCLTLCNPMQWIAMSFSRGSSQPRDRTWVSCTAGRLFNHLSHWGSPYFPIVCLFCT